MKTSEIVDQNFSSNISNNSTHIPILDGIRAYAVLMVCIYHYYQVDEKSLYEVNKYVGVFTFKITQLGLRGVELFFLLSGFLITGFLVKTKQSKNYFVSFYARRFLRIFPLYYFVLLVSFLILPALTTVDEAGRSVIANQWWLWTYTSNLSHFFNFSGWDESAIIPSFGHFWSLCVEEHFYAFWPLLVFLANKKWLPRILWFFLALSLFTTVFSFLSNDLIPFLRWSTIRGAGILSLGGLISIYWNDAEKWRKMVKLSLRFVIPMGILFVVVNFIPRSNKILYVLTEITSIIFFAALIVVSLSNNKITQKLFAHKWLYFFYWKNQLWNICLSWYDASVFKRFAI